MDFDAENIAEIDQIKMALFEIERVLFTQRFNFTKRQREIFSVQSITMSYSLWEGFIHKSFRNYIQYINDQRVAFHKFEDTIKVFHIENVYKQFNEYPKDKLKRKAKFHNSLYNFHRTDYHPIYHIVNTQSNVGFKVLNDLLITFNLKPFPKDWQSYTRPGTDLETMLTHFLRYRNGIAHGGDISSEEKVDQAVFEKYRKLVVELMYAIREKMLTGANTKSYLKKPVV